MQAEHMVPFGDERRAGIVQSVGLPSDEPLKLAVEAMIAQARSERPAHPAWHPLSGRNAEGIRVTREALEACGGWIRATTETKLEGVRHVVSGRFLAVHNTCERTGLDSDYPRFASARKRVATKSLRDDLQFHFSEIVDDFPAISAEVSPDDERTLHLCVFIHREFLDTGDQQLIARAELIIGGRCSDSGFIGCKYRVPIDVSELVNYRDDVGTEGQEREDTAEGTVEIRRRP